MTYNNQIMGKLKQSAIHVIAKPIGPVCNLNCAYCFYIEKNKLFSPDEPYRMSDEVLENFIRQYIAAQTLPEVEFVWQGGEPTLLGVDFFRKVVRLQKELCGDKKIRNSLQTNGVLLNDEWGQFLKQNEFLVGISMDGPKEIHGLYRKDRRGEGTFDAVMSGLNFLKKHEVEFNVLACVARETAAKPLEVYRFFKEAGVQFVQFTAIVEKTANGKIAPSTVKPENYGDFLIGVFDEWVRNDVGKVFVMNFEWALNAWVGNPSPVCLFSEICGRSLAIEHNGDVYACDHYVYPEYLLGNIKDFQLKDLVELPKQKKFGTAKAENLPDSCRCCKFLFVCRGECPKRRFAHSSSGATNLNYLCPGYKKYFQHIARYMEAMREKIML